MNKKYIVDLTQQERNRLRQLVRSGRHSARRIRWAQALLKADAAWTDQKVSEAFDISIRTMQRIRQRFVQEGIEVALGARSRKPRPHRRKLDGEKEARLIALACSQPPEGHTRWTLRMLADRMVELCYVDTVCHETVRRVLKKTN
jgi:transposase